MEQLPFSPDLEQEIIETLKAKTQPVPVTSKRSFLIVAGIMAFVVLTVLIPLFGNNQIPLPHATGNISARIVREPLDFLSSQSDLVWFTEEELFALPTVIFKGTIERIDNIEIDFNGVKNYHAIAHIKIDKVYRGDLDIGQTITTLLPCPISEGMWVSETEVISSIRVGSTGIFMPTLYDDSFYYQQNGATLILTDLAPYGFSDGQRFAFIDNSDEIIYDHFAYESLSSVKSLEDIEIYLNKMIK